MSIVLPLLVLFICATSLVANTITAELPVWLSDVESASVSLEKDSIVTTAKLRAKFAEEIIAQPIRDLHFMSRTAGWLYSGALDRSDSFTEMVVSASLQNCVPSRSLLPP